jgi:hypothetical protein
VRFDNVDLDQVTEMYISNSTDQGNDIGEILYTTWGSGDFTVISDAGGVGAGDERAFAITDVGVKTGSGPTDWWTFPISPLAGVTTALNDGEDMVVGYVANPSSKVPRGGDTNQVLTKLNDNDYETTWVTSAADNSGYDTITKDGINPVTGSIINFTGASVTVSGVGTTTVDIAGGGDVSGPATSTDGNVAVWDGTGGDTLQDSAIIASEVVRNTNASVTDQNIAVFTGTGGRFIQDPGVPIAAVTPLGIQFGLDELDATKTYTVDESANLTYDIDEAVYIISGGSGTVGVEIDGTPIAELTGLTLGVGQTTTPATTGNSVPLGGKVTLVFTGVTTLADVSIKLNGTKT